MISQKSYIESKGNICPNCKGGDISAERAEVEGTVAWCSVHCVECQFSWQDTFTLIGFCTEFSDNTGVVITP